MLFNKLVIVTPISYLAHHLSNNKPWLKGAIKRDGDMWKKQCGFELPFDAMYDMWKSMWGSGTHHVCVALFSLAAAFGCRERWALVAMRHSGSFDLGYEAYDIGFRIHERFFTPNGHATMPNRLLGLALLHHAISFCLIIPGNLYYGDVSLYAELVYMLALSAGIALLFR